MAAAKVAATIKFSLFLQIFLESIKHHARSHPYRGMNFYLKASKAADRWFPDEKWVQYEEGIFLSPNRPIGSKSNFIDELRDAQILRNEGSVVYLLPEIRNSSGKKYDAIVNGLQFEFKNVSGNNNTLETQFLRSRSQAPNVFINLENSNLSKKQVMAALYGARNKPDNDKNRGYVHYNKFKGGRIILKIKEHEKLIYLNVDDLLSRKKTPAA